MMVITAIVQMITIIIYILATHACQSYIIIYNYTLAGLEHMVPCIKFLPTEV